MIRPETPTDHAAIDSVEEQAFDRRDEANIVATLRAAGTVSLSLVAVLQGQIVGHILFSPVEIESEPSYEGAVAMGPLAVLPAYQRQGIGGALVQRGLEQCQQQGYGAVILFGHPTYYPRFGFVPAHHFSLRNRYVEPEHPAFMALELQPGALQGRHGLVHLAPAFDGI
ncbi:MAG: N-acetyltransferase [Chloroflexaceae bacterium]|nr:N-acetyltransferase [Chloroflexaceae bacterium]